MKNILIPVILSLISLSLLTGCGSAEAIEQYNYPTTKFGLEKAVIRVLKSNTNPAIIWDTADIVVRRYRREYKNSDEMDTIKASSYKGTFVWITIKDGGVENNYGFRYAGDEQHWKTSPGSEIFITTLWNNRELDLRQGENIGDFSNAEAKKAKKLFEKEFLAMLDKELNIKHTTGRVFYNETINVSLVKEVSVNDYLKYCYNLRLSTGST